MEMVGPSFTGQPCRRTCWCSSVGASPRQCSSGLPPSAKLGDKRTLHPRRHTPPTERDCVSSYHGWVALVHITASQMLLVNPITRAQIPLPSIALDDEDPPAFWEVLKGPRRQQQQRCRCIYTFSRIRKSLPPSPTLVSRVPTPLLHPSSSSSFDFLRLRRQRIFCRGIDIAIVPLQILLGSHATSAYGLLHSQTGLPTWVFFPRSPYLALGFTPLQIFLSIDNASCVCDAMTMVTGLWTYWVPVTLAGARRLELNEFQSVGILFKGEKLTFPQ
ncbi:hypothetical protein Taro_016594 [Colocasia esculenta]|uniref:KIB1-4 beta-propeller domain-containing protein n=1 Tax=Colocasia esculenta TaxID=4460 RepID=A0A843UL50_COLES|nr:hypothetical protein [Colocasia esculenta]